MNYSKKYAVYTLFILSIFSFAIAQTPSTKTVVDAKTKLPIENVYGSSDDGKLNIITNKEGKLIIVPASKTKSFSFYKIGYIKQTISLESLATLDSIFLVENPVSLQEIIITSRAFDTVVADKHFYINDYLILPNNDFIILTTKINIKGFEIAYYKVDKGITCKKKIIAEKNEFLVLDCFKNIHLVTDNFSRQILFKSDSTFDFLNKYPRTKFDSTIALCALKTDTQLVLKSFAASITKKMEYLDFKINSPFLTYTLQSKKNKTSLYTIFYNKHLKEMIDNHISDTRMLQQYKQQIAQGGDHLESEQSIEADMAFFYSNIAKPIYAPVFLKNDTIVLFDFQEKTIVFFTQAGKEITKVKLDENDFSSFRSFEILYDNEAKQFYFIHKVPGKTTLNRINIYSGKITRKVLLEKPFPKNIQVLNNKIYYLFREKDYDDTCYLYQQNM
ncbi:MAG: hypothetical protein ABI388_04385 [Bacteroidia bacterium]